MFENCALETQVFEDLYNILKSNQMCKKKLQIWNILETSINYNKDCLSVHNIILKVILYL